MDKMFLELKDKEIIKRLSPYRLIGRLVGMGLIIVLAFLLFKSQYKYKELDNLHKASVSTMETFRNEKGQLVSKIEAYETQRTKDFLAFVTRDSLTIELQKEVKAMNKYLREQGSVTNFETEGEAEVVTETEVIEDEEGSPIYKSKFDLDGWVFGSSIATKDSTSYKIGYKDKYSVVVGLEPTGFLGLGKGKPFGQITSSNPYNTVKTMKTYQVGLPPKKNVSIGPSLNMGVDFTGRIYTTIGVSIQPERLTIKL